MFVKEDCIWLDYATYDEDGFVNGVVEDAPDEVKQAYKRRQEEVQKHIENGTKIRK